MVRSLVVLISFQHMPPAYLRSFCKRFRRKLRVTLLLDVFDQVFDLRKGASPKRGEDVVYLSDSKFELDVDVFHNLPPVLFYAATGSTATLSAAGHGRGGDVTTN